MAGYYRVVNTPAKQKLLSDDLMLALIADADPEVVLEIIHEMYGMIWYLARGDIGRVTDAVRRHRLGFVVSPSGDEAITRPE